MRTQVGIVGAGPAGLTLAQLLQRAGDRVGRAREPQPRLRRAADPRRRARAGHGRPAGAMRRRASGCSAKGIVHHGIELQFDGERHRIPLSELTGGRAIVDLRPDRGGQGPDRGAARGRGAAPLRGRATSALARPRRERPAHPLPRTTAGEQELECDFVAGCDGFHGVCRPAIPAGVLRDVRARVPVRLARDPGRGRPVERRARLRPPRARASRSSACARPSSAASTSSAATTRTSPTGPTSASGTSCRPRLGVDGWTLAEGPILEKGVTGMRSFVAEPMQLRAPLPGRRRGAHRAADRREGAEPGDRRRRACSPRRIADLVRDAATARASTATRTPACGASGGPSTSRGG